MQSIDEKKAFIHNMSANFCMPFVPTVKVKDFPLEYGAQTILDLKEFLKGLKYIDELQEALDDLKVFDDNEWCEDPEVGEECFIALPNDKEGEVDWEPEPRGKGRIPKELHQAKRPNEPESEEEELPEFDPQGNKIFYTTVGSDESDDDIDNDVEMGSGQEGKTEDAEEIDDNNKENQIPYAGYANPNAEQQNVAKNNQNSWQYGSWENNEDERGRRRTRTPPKTPPQLDSRNLTIEQQQRIFSD